MLGEWLPHPLYGAYNYECVLTAHTSADQWQVLTVKQNFFFSFHFYKWQKYISLRSITILHFLPFRRPTYIFKISLRSMPKAPHFHTRARSRTPILHFAAAHTYQNLRRVPPGPKAIFQIIRTAPIMHGSLISYVARTSSLRDRQSVPLSIWNCFGIRENFENYGQNLLFNE